MNSKMKMIINYLVIIFFVVLDRFFKMIAMDGFLNDRSIVADFFKFNFAKNYYIAFSLPISGLLLLILNGLIIVFLVYFYLNYFKEKKFFVSLVLFLIILGSLSNYFDRLKYGYVIDYFDLKYFTVFNVADCLIILGGIVFLWHQGRVDTEA